MVGSGVRWDVVGGGAAHAAISMKSVAAQRFVFMMRPFAAKQYEKLHHRKSPRDTKVRGVGLLNQCGRS